MIDSPTIHDPASAALVRKIARRILPFVILCYLFNYIDRINIALAKLPMSRDPNLPDFHAKDDHVFALGAALFFVGYCTFEIPSNLLQQKFGARRWIARIMISWGIISSCFLFTAGPASFYTLRILLGFAEAGFFPGMVLYLSLWIPRHHRARAAAILLTSTAVAGIIGNPLGGAILYFAESFPFLKPWQYLFLLEGIPTILLGLFALFVLSDDPDKAPWLTDPERRHLKSLLDQDHSDHPSPHFADFKHAFSTPQVWLLVTLYSLHGFGFYAVNYWTPTYLKGILTNAGYISDAAPRIADLYISLFSAIPFGVAALGMILIARSSDKRNERRRHLAFALALESLGLIIAALSPALAPSSLTPAFTIAGLAIASIGAFGAFGPFWSLPNSLLVGTAAATAVALVNSIGNFCGGFIGPLVIKESLPRGFLISAALALIGSLLTLLVPLRLERRPDAETLSTAAQSS